MCWTAEESWFSSRQKTLSFSQASTPALTSSQSPTEWGERALSLGEVKRPDLEADLSLSFSVEVKNEWSYDPTPPYASMAQL